MGGREQGEQGGVKGRRGSRSGALGSERREENRNDEPPSKYLYWHPASWSGGRKSMRAVSAYGSPRHDSPSDVPARSPVPDSTEHTMPTRHVRFARKVKLFAMLSQCLASVPRFGKRPFRTQLGN